MEEEEEEDFDEKKSGGDKTLTLSSPSLFPRKRWKLRKRKKRKVLTCEIVGPQSLVERKKIKLFLL